MIGSLLFQSEVRASWFWTWWSPGSVDGPARRPRSRPHSFGARAMRLLRGSGSVLCRGFHLDAVRRTGGRSVPRQDDLAAAV